MEALIIVLIGLMPVLLLIWIVGTSSMGNESRPAGSPLPQYQVDDPSR